MGNLLGDQADIQAATPLKVKRMDDASSVVDVSSETVTFQYNNSGTLASATGQAAGTLIHAKLAFDAVLDAFKESSGSVNNTSFSFGTGTVLTTQVGGLSKTLPNWKGMTVAEKFTEVAKFLTTNGQFYVDHDEGSIWGLAAATVANDTGNYSYKAPVASAAGPTANVNLSQVAGTTTSIGVGSSDPGTQRVQMASSVPESGTDVAGEDTYATVLTPSTGFTSISISNEGVNPATVSIDGGSTDTFIRIPGGAIQVFDGVTITATAIQAKNASAGNNYANLTITVW